jgi:hypothetical protein
MLLDSCVILCMTNNCFDINQLSCGIIDKFNPINFCVKKFLFEDFSVNFRIYIIRNVWFLLSQPSNTFFWCAKSLILIVSNSSRVNRESILAHCEMLLQFAFRKQMHGVEWTFLQWFTMIIFDAFDEMSRHSISQNQVSFVVRTHKHFIGKSKICEFSWLINETLENFITNWKIMLIALYLPHCCW